LLLLLLLLLFYKVDKLLNLIRSQIPTYPHL
jgi:hypothetical protein